MPLSHKEHERYSRQILLPEFGIEGQERLSEARVLLIGAGGLSSPATLYLAAMGVGTIGIIDDDILLYRICTGKFYIAHPMSENRKQALLPNEFRKSTSR